MSTPRIDELDLETLAAQLTDIESEDPREIYAALSEKYNINEDDFANLIADLFQILHMGYSALTDEIYIGFAGTDTWHVKKPAKSKFIGTMLAFLLNDEPLKQTKNGMVRIITDKSNKPLYQVVITHHDRKVEVSKPTKTPEEQK